MSRIFASIPACLLIGSLAACGPTVDTSTTTGDNNPPQVNLLVKNVEPGVQVDPTAPPPPVVKQAETGTSTGIATRTRLELDNPLQAKRLEFSVLATATDQANGIKSVVLKMTRDLCFTSSNGTMANAHFATVERKRADYTDRANAPTQASLGDTGVFNNAPLNNNPERWSDVNLLVRKGSGNNWVDNAVGVSTKWVVEATNFKGKTSFSNVILVTAGDLNCNITP